MVLINFLLVECYFYWIIMSFDKNRDFFGEFFELELKDLLLELDEEFLLR